MLIEHEFSSFLQSPFSTPIYTYHAHGTLANGSQLICNDSQIDNCVKECARMFQPLDQKGCVDAVEQKWAPYSQCFSGDCKVVVRGRSRHVQLRELQVGDFVLDCDMQYVEVVDWLHNEPETISEFLNVQTESGGCITVTSDHLVFDPVLDKYISAGEATHLQSCYIDASLLTSKISTKHSIFLSGIYAPLTRSGTLMVNGIRVSCYASPERFPMEITHSMGQLALLPYRVGLLSKAISVDSYCRGLYQILAC